MAKVILMLAWVFLIALIFQKKETKDSPLKVCDNYFIHSVSKKYVVLLFSVPFLFVALREGFGDTGMYFWGFNGISTTRALSDYLKDRGKDELFYALEYIYKKYLSTDAQGFLAFVALIQSVLLLSTLRKNSEDMGMSVYIFIASALLLHWMCNGIRQFVAVTILFALTECILKNKWYIYLPVVLLMSGIKPVFNAFGWGVPPWIFCGIHQSAMLMIPIYFIVRGKALTKKVWILLAAFVLITVLGLWDRFLDVSTDNTMYADEAEVITSAKGANPIRFLISLVPIILVIAKRKEIVSDETPQLIHLSVNMSFVSSSLYLASVFTSGLYIGRLPIYCELYNLILIPWLINHPYKKDKQVMTYAVYTLYLLYFLYQVFITWRWESYSIKLFGFMF